MVDAEIAMKSRDYFEFHLSELCSKHGWTYPQHGCSVLVDVRYNFREKLWINGVAKSKFNNDLWFNEWFGSGFGRENAVPTYPIMADSLSIIFIRLGN